MRLGSLRRHWNELGRRDPLWAVLTSPAATGNRWPADEFLQTGRDEIAALMSYLEQRGLPAGGGRAIDFGCGAGRVTHPLSTYFDEVIGIDIAASMIEVARRMHADVRGLTFIENRSTTLEGIASDSVDLVYSRLVLQHMHPRYTRRYLTEFLRVLRPGGVLVFQLPGEDPTPVVGGGLKRLLPLRAVRLIRAARSLARFPRMEVYGLARADVEQLLTRCGARVDDVIDDRVHGADTPGYRYCVVKT
jgi:SAM-dependent methyltransferase